MNPMNIWKNWKNFWFSPVPLVNLALFRIALCFNLFFISLSRQKDFQLFFTDLGMLPKSFALQVYPDFYRPSFVLSFWPDSWVGGLHILFLFCLLLYTLGIGGRILGLICAYFSLAFLQRNYTILLGADQIGGIFIMYLAFTDCCSRLSVLNWRRKSKSADNSTDLLTPLFYRMIQVQLCVIYAYSGFEKLKGNSWWDGTALWRVLANSQMVILDLTWLRNFPLVIVLVSFLTILFEIYFPVLVFNSKTRNYILAAGVLFHAGIGFFMALFGFAGIMVAPYLLFLRPESLKNFLRRLRFQIQ